MKNAVYTLAAAATVFAMVAASQPPVVNSRYRPLYHLAPPFGWMNDPNGFSYYHGKYHLFYQYNPFSSQEPGIAHWGHATSPNLFHWKHLPIAMSPDEPYDKDGVFSGSAIVENSTLYLLYTGNVNHKNQTPDHEQAQHLAFSNDGIHFEKYKHNPVIAGADRQPNFRDPKVWKHRDTYYAVLGNEERGLGRALLYSSQDLVTWKEAAVLAESDGALGYMWECPDFFELDGKFVLLWSPQGVAPQGDNYRNLYQTGYIIGSFDYDTLQFTQETEFRELDHGHDLYASQTIRTPDGRRVMIAWMDMWEQVYPERDDGWTGLMTTPRVLRLRRAGNETAIVQSPVRELNAARASVLYSDVAEPGRAVKLAEGAAEVLVRAPAAPTGGKLGVEIEWGGDESLALWYEGGNVTLRRGPGEDDVRRAQWKLSGDAPLTWRILLDRSSVELFCGAGELVFTSRFFPSAPVSLRVMPDSRAVELHVVTLKRTVPV